MKKSVKVLVVSMIAVLAMGALAGCGSKGSTHGITEKSDTLSPLYPALCRSHHVNLRLGIVAFHAPESGLKQSPDL